jgi:hypothetical protein
MYIERVPNRNSPPAVLLRESYREGKKVRKRTLANLSKLPDDVIDNLRAALQGGVAFEPKQIPETFDIIRSLPHGHLEAIVAATQREKRTLRGAERKPWMLLGLSKPIRACLKWSKLFVLIRQLI